jgi:hypothetical protein
MYRGSGDISPPFMTLALDGVESSASCPVRFTPGGRTLVPIEQEADWAPESVRTLWSREKSLVPAVNRTPAVQPVAKPTELSYVHINIKS